MIPPSLRAFGIDEVQPQQKLDPNKYEVPRGVDRRDAFDATAAAHRPSERLRGDGGCSLTVGMPSMRRLVDRRDAFDATAAARWRARTRRVRAQPRTSRARYCCSRRRGEPLRYYGRASDYMPAGLLSDSLLYSNLHAPALCRKPRPGTSLITMVFVKYLYRYVRRQAHIFKFFSIELHTTTTY